MAKREEAQAASRVKEPPPSPMARARRAAGIDTTPQESAQALLILFESPIIILWEISDEAWVGRLMAARMTPVFFLMFGV